MSVERFHSGEQLFVVATVYENLSVILHRLRQNRQRTRVKLFLLSLCKFLWCHLTFRFVHSAERKRKLWNRTKTTRQAEVWQLETLSQVCPLPRGHICKITRKRNQLISDQIQWGFSYKDAIFFSWYLKDNYVHSSNSRRNVWKRLSFKDRWRVFYKSHAL